MPTMHIDQIIEALPHAHPFILIDRIIDYKPDMSYIHGCKSVSYNEPFFQGHFPVTPVMPGVLIIEAMAQTIGAVCLSIVQPQERELFVLVGVDGVRFKSKVVPGDQLHLKCEVIKMRKTLVKYHCQGFVDDRLCCQADLMLVREVQH